MLGLGRGELELGIGFRVVRVGARILLPEKVARIEEDKVRSENQGTYVYVRKPIIICLPRHACAKCPAGTQHELCRYYEGIARSGASVTMGIPRIIMFAF